MIVRRRGRLVSPVSVSVSLSGTVSVVSVSLSGTVSVVSVSVLNSLGRVLNSLGSFYKLAALAQCSLRSLPENPQAPYSFV